MESTNLLSKPLIYQLFSINLFYSPSANMWGMFSANITPSAAKKATCCLILNDCCHFLAQQKPFVLLPLDHFTQITYIKVRESLSSPVTIFALSASPTVHRMDQCGLYHYWSTIQTIGHDGSKLKVKGRALGTAVRSAGCCKDHLRTYIIENPPTVNAQTLLPLSLFFSYFLPLYMQSGQKDKTT